MKTPRPRTIGRNLVVTILLLMLALVAYTPPARSAGAINVTIQIPATVYDNPCVGEPVVLHGTLHIVLHITYDKAGGYHFVNTWNAAYSGTGLISGATYRASESKQESWNARQLPASHTTTSVVRLISTKTSNAFLSTTTTTTIDAAGVPTVTVNSESVTCRS